MGWRLARGGVGVRWDRGLQGQGESEGACRRRHLGGSMVEDLPSAQGVISGSRDCVPHRAPGREPASPSACVSASLTVSLMNK